MQTMIPTVGRWLARMVVIGLTVLGAAGGTVAATASTATPDYHVELTVVTDAEASAWTAKLGVRAGDPASARHDHASGSTSVTLTATPDATRVGDVAIGVRIERDGRVIGTPKTIVRLDAPAQVAASRPDGSTIYAMDLRVSRWDPAIHGR